MKDTFAKFAQFMSQQPAKRLGNLLAEYINESNHSGWEGYESRDLTGIRRFLEDMMTYHNNAGDPVHFDEPGFGGVTYFTKPD